LAALIGEWPGLSTADSMNAYLTWQLSAQTTDAERNCILNICFEGIGYADIARKIAHILLAMHDHCYSGVRLKVDSDRLLIER
jgi:ethanolamine ammonia-lyase small subunit